MIPTFRPRNTEDDRRSILRLKSDVVNGTIPLPTKTPIVSWAQDLDTNKSNFMQEEDEVLKCIDWPSSTTNLCHHCCYSFDGVPVPLPQSYDALRKVYHCRGNFCSWQCAKAYNNTQTPLSGKGNRNMYISLLAHRTWVKYRGTALTDAKSKAMKTYAMGFIYPSLPREVLLVFGGKMTIEEYREDSFGIIPPSEAAVTKPFLTIRQRLVLPFLDVSKKESAKDRVGVVLIGAIPVTQKIESSTVHRHSNAFCAKLNKAKTDLTIMKRKKDVTSKNTLMSTMGVVINKKTKL